MVYYFGGVLSFIGAVTWMFVKGYQRDIVHRSNERQIPQSVPTGRRISKKWINHFNQLGVKKSDRF